jgi:hypothetical protein
MKTPALSRATIYLTLFFGVLLTSCSLNVDSESACKDQLCKGYWSEDNNGEPLIAMYGNFEFKQDGTCYCYGLNGHKINGTWKLGNVSGGTERFRDVTVNMNESLTNLGGTSVTFTLSEGSSGHCSLFTGNHTSGDGMLYQFNDNDKEM